MNQAWELLFEGKIDEAKQLVQAEFSLATCKDYSLLNLMGYIYLYEKNTKIVQRFTNVIFTWLLQKRIVKMNTSRIINWPWSIVK